MWQYNFLVPSTWQRLPANLICCYYLNPPIEPSASSALPKLPHPTSPRRLLNVKTCGFFSVLLLTDISQSFEKCYWLLFGWSLTELCSCPFCEISLPSLSSSVAYLTSFFSSPLSLMIFLTSSVTSFKIYLQVLRGIWLSPYSPELHNRLSFFFFN